MRCKKCGTILLDTDTYCGKCGTKVVIEVCPECGEILRPGMRFCSNCGFEVIQEDMSDPEDDEIPVVKQVETIDIPFDVIEENIIRDVARQIEKPDKTVERTITPKKYEQEEFEEEYEEEYEDSDYDEEPEDDEYEDSYEYEDYVEEEDDDEPASVFSRLVTAAMIVVGLVLVLIVAVMFFKNRKENQPVNNTEQTVQEENSAVENQVQQTDNIAGTLNIIKNVNIRDFPTTENSTVLGVAKEGESYEYYGYADENDNWVHIKVDDVTDGYVYKDYVQF